MTTHPITGITQIVIDGETRTLACDMNCAAVLYESVGDLWSRWLADRFFGKPDGDGRFFTPVTPSDQMIVLHALLATDRMDNFRPEETATSLGRRIGMQSYPNINLACVRSVMASFGIPGEAIEAVIKAVDEPRKRKPAGTGSRR